MEPTRQSATEGPQRRRRPLPARPTATAAFSLADCHRLLVQEFGEPSPSLVTMKRHAAAGELKALEAPRRGTRPLYIYARVRDHYEPRIRKPAVPSAPPALADDQMAAIVSQAVAAALEPFGQALQEGLSGVREQLAKLTQEVAGLSAVRQSLMLKYDAAAAAAHTRADQLHDQLRDARRLQDVDTQMRRVLTEVSRVQSSIAQILSAQAQA